MAVPKNIGMLLLTVFLIVFGLVNASFGVSFSHSGDVVAILAIAAGVAIAMNR